MDVDSHRGIVNDQPIKDSSEDLLDRTDFANDLSKMLSKWRSDKSLVISLNGDWGSGKSSIKNMAISKLLEDDTQEIDVVEFSPWEWAAQEKITSTFFSEISNSIGRKSKDENSKALAGTYERYGQYLNTGELAAKGIAASFPIVLILMASAGFGGNLLSEYFGGSVVNVLFALLAVVGASCAWGGKILRSISKSHKLQAEKNKQSLDDVRSELTKLLSKRNCPIIVVVDDLDRLTSEQLRMVIQLVKANSEFPNLIFILIFQKDIVENKLHDGPQNGRDFLEKIVQIPIDIPKIEISRIHDILETRINEIVGTHDSANRLFNRDRWIHLFSTSLHHYFDNLRNIYRFTSTLSFQYSLVSKGKEIEVNPVDLIAMECLRVFEPSVFNQISRTKDELTSRPHLNTSKRDKIIESAVDLILSAPDIKNLVAVKQILKELFPNITTALGENRNISEAEERSFITDLRICCDSHFNKYFQFSVPLGQISHSDIQEIISLTSDREVFLNRLLQLQKNGLLKQFLYDFESFSVEVPLINKYEYVRALIDIGDMLEKETLTGLASIRTIDHLERILVQYLRRIECIEERSSLVFDCFKDSSALVVVEGILIADESRRKDKSHNLVLSDAVFNNMKEEFVNKLNDMSENSPDELMSNEHLASFLYRWSNWGEESIVTDWLASQTYTLEGCLRLIKHLVTETTIYESSRYAPKRLYGIKLTDKEKFIPIKKISTVLDDSNIEGLSSPDKQAIEYFQEALT
ncbi:KAP family NTPase, partial [Vibrio sp. S4M6]